MNRSAADAAAEDDDAAESADEDEDEDEDDAADGDMGPPSISDANREPACFGATADVRELPRESDSTHPKK